MALLLFSYTLRNNVSLIRYFAQNLQIIWELQVSSEVEVVDLDEGLNELGNCVLHCFFLSLFLTFMPLLLCRLYRGT